MLFADIKEHDISLPAKLEDGKAPNVDYLVRYLCENTMKDRRKELFIQDDSV